MLVQHPTPPQIKAKRFQKCRTNPDIAENKALIIIDFQNEFISEKGNFPISDMCRPTVLTNFKILISRFRREGGHIIWVKAIYENRSEEPTGMAAQEKGNGVVGNNEWLTVATHVYHVPCCENGTWGAEIYPEIFALAKPEDEVVTKGGYSAFHGTTALLDVLHKKSITSAYFCGVASGTCVLATVLDALKIGEVNVHVVPDCLGYRRLNTHEEALRRMKVLGVSLVESGQI